jgi:hypothetical protein
MKTEVKRVDFRYHLQVPASVIVGLFIVILAACYAGQRIESKKNTGSIRLVPMSQLHIPVESAKEAEVKSQAFLKFFKTPTKQFMPLGLFAMERYMRDSEKLEALRRRGIILFHKYHSQQEISNALADLRSAQKAGAAVLQNLPRKYLFTKGRDFWEQHISALVGNNQILVWYLPGETKAENLDKLELLSNIIRSVDNKKRPTMTYVNDPDSEYLKRVGGIADAVSFGAYPSLYSPRPRADVKRRIEKAYESGVPVVIACLEALKGRRNWTRPKDIRFDAYLALISDAKGIMWYCYAQAIQQPKLLEAILEVATELNGPERLGEVLLSGTKTSTINCTLITGPALTPPASAYEGKATAITKRYASLQWTSREHKNHLYIFAVNAAQEVEKLKALHDGGPAYRVTARFGPIKSVSSRATVIGEGRTIELSGGYFEDSFEPLGTHIYKISLN